MFLIEEALQQVLRLDAGVSAIVGARVYPGTFPQDVTLPAICYRLLSREHELRLDPESSSGLAHSAYEFTFAATTYLPAKYLEETARLCLQGLHDIIARDSGVPETIEIQAIFPGTSRDQFYDEANTHFVFTTFEVHHEVVMPT